MTHLAFLKMQRFIYDILNKLQVVFFLYLNNLDGVAEVAYIHSNQNVVGSSKAENHMSRWAVRDVFEFNQFSQLPANVTALAVEVRETTSCKVIFLLLFHFI